MATRKPANRSTNGTVIDHCVEISGRVKSVNSIVSSAESKRADLHIAMKHVGQIIEGLRAMGNLPGLDLDEWFFSDSIRDIPKPGV